MKKTSVADFMDSVNSAMKNHNALISCTINNARTHFSVFIHSVDPEIIHHHENEGLISVTDSKHMWDLMLPDNFPLYLDDDAGGYGDHNIEYTFKNGILLISFLFQCYNL